MRDKVIQTIEKYHMLEQGHGVLIGVSGGPDSISLLHILKSLEERLQLRLMVVHINHLLRGRDSDDDERYVKELCREWNIPCKAYRIDIAGLSKALGVSLEVAGRKARYGTFHRIKKEYQLDRIALGQHGDDNAETIIMRMIRGTGPKGLSGISPLREDGVIRPLLYCTREEIEAYCRENGLVPRVDKTNLEPIYFRNRVRLEIIPYLEGYNGQFKTNLRNMSELIREQQEYIDSQMTRLWNRNIKNRDGEIIIPIAWFEELSQFEKKEMLRRSIKGVKRNLREIEYKHIQLVLEMLEREDNTTWVLQLPENIRVEMQYQSLIIKDKREEASGAFQHPLVIGGSTYIPELDLECSVRLEKREQVGIIKSSPQKGYFDFNKVGDQLVLRNRRVGDRFWPSGSYGSKKLKDFFIDLKIPRSERDRIPIIANPDHILWVAGYRVDERAIVDSSTQDVLIIEIKHKEEPR